MATNVQLDEDLMAEAMRLGHHPSKRAAIEAALREYVEHRKQADVLELFGEIDYDPAYDYKVLRKKSR
ncbi:MAG TPA: type II toxin-antitoxin system VapB family antitoxin [Chthoniobacterales bacterium]